MVRYAICGVATVFKIDTAPNCNVMSTDIFLKLKNEPKLLPVKKISQSPGGILNPMG